MTEKPEFALADKAITFAAAKIVPGTILARLLPGIERGLRSAEPPCN